MCCVDTDGLLSLIKEGTGLIAVTLHSSVAHELLHEVGSIMYACVAPVQ